MRGNDSYRSGKVQGVAGVVIQVAAERNNFPVLLEAHLQITRYIKDSRLFPLLRCKGDSRKQLVKISIHTSPKQINYM